MMDTLYQPCCGLNVKTAAGADGDAAQVSTRFLAGGDDGFHQVPGLESESVFAPG